MRHNTISLCVCVPNVSSCLSHDVTLLTPWLSNGQAALGWASSHYKLNPWRRIEQHQAGLQLLPGCPSFRSTDFLGINCWKLLMIFFRFLSGLGTWNRSIYMRAKSYIIMIIMMCLGVGHCGSWDIDGSCFLVHGPLPAKSFRKAEIMCWEYDENMVFI